MAPETDYTRWIADEEELSFSDDTQCKIYSRDDGPSTVYGAEWSESSEDDWSDADEIGPESETILKHLRPRQRLINLSEFLTLGKGIDEEKINCLRDHMNVLNAMCGSELILSEGDGNLKKNRVSNDDDDNEFIAENLKKKQITSNNDDNKFIAENRKKKQITNNNDDNEFIAENLKQNQITNNNKLFAKNLKQNEIINNNDDNEFIAENLKQNQITNNNNANAGTDQNIRTNKVLKRPGMKDIVMKKHPLTDVTNLKDNTDQVLNKNNRRKVIKNRYRTNKENHWAANQRKHFFNVNKTKQAQNEMDATPAIFENENRSVEDKGSSETGTNKEIDAQRELNINRIKKNKHFVMRIPKITTSVTSDSETNDTDENNRCRNRKQVYTKKSSRNRKTTHQNGCSKDLDDYEEIIISRNSFDNSSYTEESDGANSSKENGRNHQNKRSNGDENLVFPSFSNKAFVKCDRIGGIAGSTDDCGKERNGKQVSVEDPERKNTETTVINGNIFPNCTREIVAGLNAIKAKPIEKNNTANANAEKKKRIGSAKKDSERKNTETSVINRNIFPSCTKEINAGVNVLETNPIEKNNTANANAEKKKRFVSAKEDSEIKNTETSVINRNIFLSCTKQINVMEANPIEKNNTANKSAEKKKQFVSAKEDSERKNTKTSVINRNIFPNRTKEINAGVNVLETNPIEKNNTANENAEKKKRNIYSERENIFPSCKRKNRRKGYSSSSDEMDVSTIRKTETRAENDFKKPKIRRKKKTRKEEANGKQSCVATSTPLKSPGGMNKTDQLNDSWKLVSSRAGSLTRISKRRLYTPALLLESEEYQPVCNDDDVITNRTFSKCF